MCTGKDGSYGYRKQQYLSFLLNIDDFHGFLFKKRWCIAPPFFDF
jgi:hypothetical protein